MTVTYKVEVDEDGNTFWYNQQGKRHREGGLPAIEYANGGKEWWVNGHHVTEDQAKDMFNKPASCAGKVVEIDGKKFKLTEIT